MARVTLITQWFPPEPAYLWKDLAIELKKSGHDVTVVTAFPNYPFGEIYEGYKQTLSHTEEIDGITVIRLPVYPDRSSSFIKRGASYVSFALSLAIIGLFRIPKSDIFLCYSPPLTVGVSVAWLSIVKRVPFILNIQDMWPDTLVSTGMIKEGYITRFIAKVAMWLYKRSTHIVVLSEGFRHYLINKGVTQEKITSISNWSSDEQIPNIPSEVLESHRRKYGFIDKDIIVTFAGNMGPAQALDVVIDAAELTNNLSSVKYFFVGDGMSIKGLQDRVEKKNLTNVVFAGRVAYEEMGELYAMSDILLIHLMNDPLFKITIPHKLLTYLSVGKPIVSAVPGEVNNIVEEASAGFTCNSEDPEGLSKIIRAACELSESEKAIMRENSMSYFENHFTKEILTAEWAELISKTLKKLH